MSKYSDHFDREFIRSLPDEPLDALSVLLERWNVSGAADIGEPTLRDYVRLYSFVHSLALESEISVSGITDFEPDGASTQGFMKYVDKVFLETMKLCEGEVIRRELARGDDLAEEFREIRSQVEVVEFSDKQFQQIQELTNELRDLIVSTRSLDENHRSRMLARLEEFQRELHKKMSNLDRFWTFFGEAGVRAGEFGENAKPFTDRLREIAQVVMKAIDFPKALTGELGKLLPAPEDDNAEDD